MALFNRIKSLFSTDYARVLKDAQAALDRGNAAQAVEMLTPVVDVDIATIKPDQHPSIAQSCVLLAKAIAASGREEEACRLIAERRSLPHCKPHQKDFRTTLHSALESGLARKGAKTAEKTRLLEHVRKLGAEYLQAGDLDGCRRLLDATQKCLGDRPELLDLRAELLQRSKDYPEAARVLEALAKSDTGKRALVEARLTEMIDELPSQEQNRLRCALLNARGRLYFDAGEYAASVEDLETACAGLGQEFENWSVLLAGYGKTKNTDGLVQFAELLLARNPGPDVTTEILAHALKLSEEHPDNSRLLVVSGACYMSQGRYSDAIPCFDRAIAYGAEAGKLAVAWYKRFSEGVTAIPQLAIAMSRAHLAAEETEEALAILVNLNTVELPPAELASCEAVLSAILRNHPDRTDVRELHVACLLRQGDSHRALDDLRCLLDHTPIPKSVVRLVAEVGATAARLNRSEDKVAAMRLECEAHLKVPAVGPALTSLGKMAEMSDIGKSDLEWAAAQVTTLAGDPGLSGEVYVLAARIFARLGRHADAVHSYTSTLGFGTGKTIIKDALTGLKAAESALKPDKQDECQYGLVQAYVLLGDCESAKPHVVRLASQKGRWSEALFSFLRKAREQKTTAMEVATLELEAVIAVDNEALKSDGIATAQFILDGAPQRGRQVYAQVQRLLTSVSTPATRLKGELLCLDVLAKCGEHEELAARAESVATSFPDCRSKLVELLSNSRSAAPAPGQAHLSLGLAKLHLLFGKQGYGSCCDCLRAAVDEDSGIAAEPVIAESLKLAEAADGYPAAALVAIHAANATHREETILPHLTRLVACLDINQLKQVATFVSPLTKRGKSAAAWFLKARISGALKDVGGALSAYKQILKLSPGEMLPQVCADLEKLESEHAETPDVCLTRVDAEIQRGNIGGARLALSARLNAHPGDAAILKSRFETLGQGEAASIEDQMATARCLCLSGDKNGVAAIMRRLILQKDAPLRDMAKLMEETWGASPEAFDVQALNFRLRSRLATGSFAKKCVAQLEGMLAHIPTEGCEDSLQEVLSDCSLLSPRLAGDDDTLRRLQHCTVRIHERLGEAEAAAAALRNILDRWPEDAAIVHEAAQRLASATPAIGLSRVLASACRILNKNGEAIEVLRMMVDHWPDAAGAAEEDAQRAVQNASDVERAQYHLLQGDMLVLMDRQKDAVAAYREAAGMAIVCDEVIRRLAALTDRRTDCVDAFLLLAELESARGEDGVRCSCATIDRMLAAEFNSRVDTALRFMNALANQVPKDIAIPLHIMEIRMRQGPEFHADVLAVGRGILAQFGRHGAERVGQFCQSHLSHTAEAIPLWYLSSDACLAAENYEGSVVSLSTIKEMALPVECEELERRVAALHDAAGANPVVAVFRADIAADTGEAGDAGRRYAEAMELPNVDLEHIRSRLAVLLSSEPNNPYVLLAAARAEWLRGDPAAAAACYRKVSRVTDVAVPVHSKLTDLRAAFPEHAAPAFVIGEELYAQERFEEAISHLTDAVSLRGLGHGIEPLARKYLAEALAARGQYASAIEQMTVARQLAPDDDHTARRLITLHFESLAAKIEQAKSDIAATGATPEKSFTLASLLRDYGSYDEAAEHFRVAAGGEDFRARSLIAMAKCQLNTYRCDLAAVNFRAALEADGGGGTRKDALFGLGVAYGRLLRFDTAVATLEELCAEDPSYPGAMKQLGELRAALLRGGGHMAEIPFDMLNTWRTLIREPRTKVAEVLAPNTDTESGDSEPEQ